MLVMHVILMEILASRCGWWCVEKEVPQEFALDTMLAPSLDPVHGVPGQVLIVVSWPLWLISILGGLARFSCSGQT